MKTGNHDPSSEGEGEGGHPKTRDSETKDSCSESLTSTTSSSSNQSSDDRQDDEFYTPCSSLATTSTTPDFETSEEHCNADDTSNYGCTSRDENSQKGVRIITSSISPLIATDEDEPSKEKLGGPTSEKVKEHNHKDSHKSTKEQYNQKVIKCNENNSSMSLSFFKQERESIKASVSSKASPLALTSWIAVALTLDGRDKITKVIQYASRFLGYYYETLAGAIQDSNLDDDPIQKNIYAYYVIKAVKFRKLYKAMNTSRKAYRFGRTFIELEKLRSMGLIHWIAWYLRSNMFIEAKSDNSKQKEASPITTSRQDSTVSFHPNTKFKKQLNKDAQPIAPKITLPRQISSNVGFKPSYDVYSNGGKEKYVQSLSYIGQFLFRSLSSVIDEEKLTTHTSNKQQSPPPPPPLWKIVSSALKLLGLAGFWTGDNITYLYSIGFIVDKNGKCNKRRQDAAANFAMRSYFFGALAGLYLNSREWIQYRNGTYMEISKEVNTLKMEIEKHEEFCDDNKSNHNEAYEDHQRREDLIKLEKKLETVKLNHFTKCLALLKVSCLFYIFIYEQQLQTENLLISKSDIQFFYPHLEHFFSF